MKSILCLSDQPWSREPGRTQQLLSRMREVQVLFCEPAQGPLDLRCRRPGRRVRPGLTVYTLPPVWGESRPLGLLQEGALRFLERLTARHRLRDPLLWCAAPWAVPAAGRLGEGGVVYDCARDWSHLPARWESDLCLDADVSFAASPELAEHLSPCSDNVVLLPNGANCSLERRGALARPPALEGLSGPVLGYAGTIWRDLDLEPVLQAALAYPQARFVLVGRREKNPLLPRLSRLPNVLQTGPVPLVDLPEYLACFDVCLNLVRLRSPDNDVLPPRIFEYFSTGRPVVALAQPGRVEEYPDVIYWSEDAAEFVRLCASALAEGDGWARTRRLSYAAAASWSGRAGEVRRILESIGLL